MKIRHSKYEALEYCASAAILGAGVVYLLVPLYKIYCKRTGFSQSSQKSIKPELDTANARTFTVKLTSTVGKDLPWQFHPSIPSIMVTCGKPTLAFYRTKNMTATEITGIATYNVLPSKAALYFNKIQCFCFEKQTLGPHEEVDMPVYFYIDPEINQEKGLGKLKDIILSYSIFRVRS
jgi:cytochrome c oxidase assembly protein subunit 11